MNNGKCFVTILFSQTSSFYLGKSYEIHNERFCLLNWKMATDSMSDDHKHAINDVLYGQHLPKFLDNSNNSRVKRFKKIVIILEFTQDSVYWSSEARGEITDCESVKNQIQLYLDFLMLRPI